MYTLGIRDVRDQPGVLIRCLGVSSLAWDVVKSFAVLPLVTSDHVDGLLEQVKIEVLVRTRRGEIEVTIYKRLATGVE